jgi:hypothetical protein
MVEQKNGILLSLALIASIVSCGEREQVATSTPAPVPTPAQAPAPAPVARKPAEGVIAELYQQHASDAGPFFQTKSRELVDKYFEKSLADLIWSDAVASNGEVGALGFDPLYDAQDTDIKNFAVQPATVASDHARVIVTFDNFGEGQKIIWSLVPSGDAWKVADVTYGDGRTLRSAFATQ